MVQVSIVLPPLHRRRRRRLFGCAVCLSSSCAISRYQVQSSQRPTSPDHTAPCAAQYRWYRHRRKWGRAKWHAKQNERGLGQNLRSPGVIKCVRYARKDEMGKRRLPHLDIDLLIGGSAVGNDSTGKSNETNETNETKRLTSRSKSLIDCCCWDCSRWGVYCPRISPFVALKGMMAD